MSSPAHTDIRIEELPKTGAGWRWHVRLVCDEGTFEGEVTTERRDFRDAWAYAMRQIEGKAHV